MNHLQLEQLISGYLDDELSPNRKLEIKNLLQSDPAAQKLYDEFVAIRDEIRQVRRRNLPHDFQKQLFDRIDRETVTVSGKRIEHTTAVDFTLPVSAELQPEWQTHKPVTKTGIWLSLLLTRLKNPRVWVFPAVALLVGLMFYAVNFYSGNPILVQVPPQHIIGEPAETPSEFFVPPPPLPGGGSIPESDVSQSLAYRDGKPIVEMKCELSPTARDNQYIPKLLANNDYSFIIRENGNKAVTVYEFEIARDQVLSVLSMLESSNQDEIKSYQYPPAFLTLLNRSPGTGDSPEETSTISAIIVRLNVAK